MIASRKALEPARYCLTGSELALVKHNRAVVHCPAWAGLYANVADQHNLMHLPYSHRPRGVECWG